MIGRGKYPVDLPHGQYRRGLSQLTRSVEQGKNMEHIGVHTRFAACGIALLSALGTIPALAADAHVHGRAALQVAVDGKRLLLELTSPLDNLVGFEHAPRNEKQTAAVRRMAERLHKPELLFVPTPEAGCTPASVMLESDVLDPALLAVTSPPHSPPHRTAAQEHKSAAKGKGKGKDTQEEHAALSAQIIYSCEQPEKLASLEVRLFDGFPHVRRIDVQVAGQRKQVAARLTSKNRRVSW
jgi:hypothetical protein